jgi:hypothetical protein
MKGLHSLARVVAGLGTVGVTPDRVLPVVNRAPRRPRQRAEVAEALAALLAPVGHPAGGPLFLPDRRQVEDALRDGQRLPAALVQPVGRAAGAFLELADERNAEPVGPQPVRPGSLGHYEEAG